MTIIETLISITMLAVALTSFVSLVSGSLKQFRVSEKNYTAAKLAQEGMELAVAKRDNHVQCRTHYGCAICPWQENLWPAGSTEGHWSVDSTEPNQLLPENKFDTFDPNDTICIVSQPTNESGEFAQCSELPPPQRRPIPGNFTREVIIKQITPVNIRVKSIVRWDNDKEYTLETVLFGKDLISTCT
jgi:type II secretory pathway pseudopilin PulG